MSSRKPTMVWYSHSTMWYVVLVHCTVPGFVLKCPMLQCHYFHLESVPVHSERFYVHPEKSHVQR